MMSKFKSVSRGFGQFFAVGLPSLFILLWTLDAPLVPGADVFVIALIQVLFLAVFIAWIRRTSR